MIILDATIVNIALPSIQKALHFSPTSLAWVLNAYTLAFGGLLLLGGRTGDLFGRRRMFIIGILIFAGASLAGGFATTSGFLLVCRVLQGAGGAIASPTALALDHATRSRRTRRATAPSACTPRCREPGRRSGSSWAASSPRRCRGAGSSS